MRRKTLEKIHTAGAALTAASILALMGVAGGFDTGSMTVMGSLPYIAFGILGAWLGTNMLNKR